MATVKADNVTKWDAGGSGDNAIGNGYIKAIEQVWIDSYTLSAALASDSSILIARVPKNRKVTEIVVHMPIVQATAASGGTNMVYCCTGATTSPTTYFGKLTLKSQTQKLTFEAITAATLRLDANAGDSIMTPLPADVGIYITIDPATTETGVTIRTMVKYV